MPLGAWTWSWNTIHHYYSSLGQSETTRPGQLQGVRNWKEERWRTSHACDQPHYISSVFSSLRLNISDTASFPLTSHHHDIWPQITLSPRRDRLFFNPNTSAVSGTQGSSRAFCSGEGTRSAKWAVKTLSQGRGQGGASTETPGRPQRRGRPWLMQSGCWETTFCIPAFQWAKNTGKLSLGPLSTPLRGGASPCQQYVSRWASLN